MIDKRLVPYGGLKKEPFSGSHHGMRYLMNGDDGKNSTNFTVWVYPEPWCFEQTPDEERRKRRLSPFGRRDGSGGRLAERAL